MPTEELFSSTILGLTINTEEVKAEFQQGNSLNIFTRLSGELDYNFLPQPVLKPVFLLVEKYRLSSFLGQYGAGRTIKTFSLLPGEKTTISISSYKKSSSTATEASSILDSYTSETADEFESSVMDEQSSTDNESKSFEYHAEAEAKASWGWGSASVSGGVSGGSNSSREEFAKNVTSATEKHAATASAKRDIEINTSFEVTEESGEDRAITREIENINVGRTLNFTHRQMNQEFITLLHLVDVRVAYFNGFGESKDEVPLSQIDSLLDKYVVESKQKEVKQTLLGQLKTVMDHEDNAHSVVEEVSLPNSPDKYWRFKKTLVSTYEDRATGTQIDVPGLIISAKKNVMRTDGVIVEALLGQAEALDKYSRGLQDEKVKAQQLANQRLELELRLEEARQNILRDQNREAAEVYGLLYNSGPEQEEPAVA